MDTYRVTASEGDDMRINGVEVMASGAQEAAGKYLAMGYDFSTDSDDFEASVFVYPPNGPGVEVEHVAYVDPEAEDETTCPQCGHTFCTA